MPTRTPTLLLLLPPLVAACTATGNTRLPDNAAYPDASLEKLSCLPNLDARIDAAELQPAPGVAATYLVTPPGTTTPVDLEGHVDASGKRTWDWSAGASRDRLASLTATTLAGKWYAASFPTGQIAAPVDAAGSIEGVYVKDDRAFSLLGVASRDENPPEGKTLVVYDAPVALFQFPLQVGASWTAVGDATDAVVRGLPDATHDTYEVKVDASGSFALPDFTFTQVLRVRTTTTVKPAVGVTTVTRQVSFLFECFGEVARATSQPNEPSDDFQTAAEVRRLGAPPE